MPKIGFPMPTAKTRFQILNLHPKKHVFKKKHGLEGKKYVVYRQRHWIHQQRSLYNNYLLVYMLACSALRNKLTRTSTLSPNKRKCIKFIFILYIIDGKFARNKLRWSTNSLPVTSSIFEVSIIFLWMQKLI